MLFILPFTDEHFHHLPIVNSAALNRDVQISVPVLSFNSCEYIPGSEIFVIFSCLKCESQTTLCSIY